MKEIFNHYPDHYDEFLLNKSRVYKDKSSLKSYN